MSWRLASALSLGPGMAVVALALAGVVPIARDLPDYFVPLRGRTAQVLAGHSSPWLNEQVGCGEPFFANPQSALLYPLAWWALVMPAERAVGVEVGVHLGILAFGVLCLARRLGAAPQAALAAAWGAALSGPVLSAAGMLNNLETAAWLPWVWDGALAGRTWGLALAVAASFLAAEPVLALLGVLGAVLLAPRWPTLRGAVLGVAVCAVQLVPMAFWIAAGDRGLDQPLEAMTLGGVTLGEVPALLFPGFPMPEAEVRFLPLLTLPLWAALGVTTLRPQEHGRFTLGLFGLACLGLAVLPTLPWGDAFWAGISFGLVRLPGRFVIPAVLALLPAAAAGQPPRRGWWVGATTALGAVGMSVSNQPELVFLQALLAALAPWRFAAASAASLALGLSTPQVLELQRWAPEAAACLKAQEVGRLYPLPVDSQQMRWVGQRGTSAAASLAWGYAVLRDGRQLARSFGPLTNRVLAQHLAMADRGPAYAWWVAALGAASVLSLKRVATYPVVCREDGLWVHRNPSAFPLWAVVRALPSPPHFPELVGEAILEAQHGVRWRFRVRASSSAVFLWLFTPDRGWRFFHNGVPVLPERGVGILQGVRLVAGEQLVEVAYRPPGLLLGLGISLAALVVLGVLWRR
ncbi:MAG: hypothetical protein NZ869_02070 [Thermoanaerobaculum sp.]|nr:hypothetical protein [Thermoanaerobaculum sp.]MDW7968776.1 hypothetical protein [Thermoanaerobaculum sp.]